MPTFHRLRISDIRQETADCISIAFEVPEAESHYFSFKPGQHLGLRTRLNGQEVRRTYSICSMPGSGEYRIAIKRVPGGRFSNFAHTHLKVGDEMEVMPPGGRFILEPEASRAARYVAFAAGSGITPVMSMLGSVLDREPDSHFTLFYGNSRLDSIIFLEALEALKNQYMERFSLYHILSRQQHRSSLFSGRIDADRAGKLLDSFVDPLAIRGYFLCGPFPMIEGVTSALRQRNVPGERIHFELFTPVGTRPARPRRPVSAPAGKGELRITLDGHTQKVPISSRGHSILELAQQEGVSVPYACKGGVCSTCRAHLDSGEVDMPVNYALEADECAAGYILTCQAYPVSRDIAVNFDT